MNLFLFFWHINTVKRLCRSMGEFNKATAMSGQVGKYDVPMDLASGFGSDVS